MATDSMMQHQHQQHQRDAEPPETSPALTKEYHDGFSTTSSPRPSSSSQQRIPLSSFETSADSLDQDTYHLEDGYVQQGNTKRQRSWKGRGGNWWGFKDIMTVRARRIGSLDSDRTAYKDEGGVDGGVPLLAEIYATRRIRRKRNWYNYCIFSGISGLTVLAILLILNLLLTLATLIWSTDVDPALQNWGQPGTGTEGLAWYPTDFTRGVQPIACHSHNDYWRRVPLFSALRAGCTGVEADVWLFDDELYVGHNTASLTRNRTFTSLYIDPLVRILEAQNPTTRFYNGTGQGVFDVDPEQTLTLLIDVKTSGAETWPWVLSQIQPLRERGWLSFMENDILHTRPITVVGTGNTPFDLLTQNSTYRDTFFDAPLDMMWEPRVITPEMANWPALDDSQLGEHLDEDEGSAEEFLPSSTHDLGQGLSGTTPNSSFTPLNSYYASVKFGKAVGRIWRGRLSPRQMKIIRGQVRGAHRRGLKARYWDLPSWPLGLRDHVWDVLIKEGVDFLNVDDLRAASRLVW